MDNVCDSCSNCSRKNACAWSCCFVVFLVGMILLIVSFVYVEFDEYAFRKDTTANQVYTDTVYENGRYLWGPNWDVVTFSRLFTETSYEDEESLDVGNSEGIQVNIEVNFWYRLRHGKLANLYNKYGLKFHLKAKSIAKAALKNTAVDYTLSEYLRAREEIAWAMNKNVSRAIDEIWLELEDHKLRLGHIAFTPQIQNKFLESAVQLEKNQQKEFEQDAALIRENTKERVQSIQSNTTVVERRALANKERIIEVANADASEIIGKARGDGLSLVINNLTISNDTTRQLFLKLMAILDNQETRLVDANGVILNL